MEEEEENEVEEEEEQQKQWHSGSGPDIQHALHLAKVWGYRHRLIQSKQHPHTVHSAG